MSNDHKVIGRPVPRADSRSKVLGEARYADDLSLPGMVYGKVLRSPHPHARIRSIDTSRAGKCPGVVTVLTAKDIPGQNTMGPIIKDQPVLCSDVVRYVGDAVALVGAETERAAEEALAQIVVEYEALAPVLDPLKAMEPGAPQVHSRGNIGTHYKVRRGDVEAAFRDAAEVVEKKFFYPRVEHAYMETEIALVAGDPSGGVTVWSSTQYPHLDREEVSRVLGLPQSRVRVHQMMTGGGFGGKLNPHAQCLAALIAWKTGRPAKLRYSREESLIASYKCHPYVIDMKLGANREGKLLAVGATLVGNTGAYLLQGRAVITKSATHVSGPYYIPNIKADGYAVFTNCVPCGAMRGYGVPQVAFALESLMDELAGRLGLDPIELRMRNALDTTLPNATGQIMRASVPIKEMLGRAKLTVQALRPLLEQAPESKRRGVGVACSTRGIGSIRKASRSTAVVGLHPDGSVTVACGHVDLGQGSNTMMAQVAAEELGVDVERVEVITNDTAVAPDCESTSASRVTYLSGNAVRLAAAKTRLRVLELAAQDLGCAPEDLRLMNGSVVYREQGVRLAELFSKHTFHSMTSVAEFLPDTVPLDPETGQGSPAGTFNFNVHVALVEVDEGTGQVRVLRYVALTDVGRMINPLAVEGQVHGGMMMGLGSALMEEVRVEEGVTNSSFATYLIPTTFDVPQELLIEVVEDPEPTGPFGAKGFAEGSLDPVGATIANAVTNAIGVRINRLPMIGERIHELLHRRST
ncbi:MAG: xanthine dehydrogenase family protein molybdopterin-binding subunit [Deltaproteobacteria bacterium]|nr:xanthine dehydrogenase family protein molybdopterin-binding subunit [Deltaproteobacteria bacterium]